MLLDRRRRRVVGEVIVVASLLLGTLGGGYLVLAGSGEEDRLVTRGIQQIVICRKGSSQSGDILYKITQEIPGAESGTWGVEKDGDCRVMRHYADTGPAD